VTVFARSTLRSASGGLITDPPTGPTDQQGFTAARLVIPLAQPAPIVPTLAPTPIPPPTPVPTVAVVKVAPTVAPTLALVATATPVRATQAVPTSSTVAPPNEPKNDGSLVPWLLGVPAVIVAGAGLYLIGRRSGTRPPPGGYPAPPVLDPDKKVIVQPLELDEYGELRPKPPQPKA